MSLQLETLQNKSQRPFMAYPSLVTSDLTYDLLHTQVSLLISKITGTPPPLGFCISWSLCLDHSLTSFGSFFQVSLLWPPYFKLQCTNPSYFALLFALFHSTFNILYDLPFLDFLVFSHWNMSYMRAWIFVSLLMYPKYKEQCLAHSRLSGNSSEMNTYSV